MEFNEGLLVQNFRADANYTIFDKNFAIYQYIKNYKAVLYSKRNMEYRNRTYLSADTAWTAYDFNNEETKMKYRYRVMPDDLVIELAIDLPETSCMNTRSISARVAWYDNDITSCRLQRHVDSGVLSDKEAEGICEKEIPVITRNYYADGGEYSEDIRRTNMGKAIVMSDRKEGNVLSIEFRLPKVLLFEVLDTAAFEVKLMENHSQTVSMSMGSRVDVISMIGS